MDGHNPTKATGWMEFHRTHVPHTRLDEASKRTQEDDRAGVSAVKRVAPVKVAVEPGPLVDAKKGSKP